MGLSIKGLDSGVFRSLLLHNGKYPGDPQAYGAIIYINKWSDVDGEATDVYVAFTQIEFADALLTLVCNKICGTINWGEFNHD